jgi:hypothetical protein
MTIVRFGWTMRFNQGIIEMLGKRCAVDPAMSNVVSCDTKSMTISRVE